MSEEHITKDYELSIEYVEKVSRELKEETDEVIVESHKEKRGISPLVESCCVFSKCLTGHALQYTVSRLYRTPYHHPLRR